MNLEKSYTQLVKGDKKAFELIFNQFYPSMCIVAKKYIKEDDLAKDIAQESFIKLWNNREKLNSPESLKYYLYSTCKNLCINHFNSKNYNQDNLSEDFDMGFSDYENKVLEEETHRLIQDAVELLPSQSKKIILLSMQGIKNQEIALRLDISVNTVKTLKYNALKTLKENLKDYFIVFILLYGKQL